MTKLLVSVRDALEAAVALEGGADLIDVKEPRHGSLGKADSTDIEAVGQLVKNRKPLSVALGELADHNQSDTSPVVLPENVGFAKVGLAGCRHMGDWRKSLEKLWQRVPASVGRIGVIYADWQAAGAPAPAEVLELVGGVRHRGVLIDTFDKSLPGLGELWTCDQIQETVAHARELGLIVVLAGRITLDGLPRLMAHRPDFVAVRGSVCQPDRNGRIDGGRIRAFREYLAENCHLIEAVDSVIH